MKPPKYSDLHRYRNGYTPSEQMGEGYLSRRFKEIEARQKEEAANRLKQIIQIKRGAK